MEFFKLKSHGVGTFKIKYFKNYQKCFFFQIFITNRPPTCWYTTLVDSMCGKRCASQEKCPIRSCWSHCLNNSCCIWITCVVFQQVTMTIFFIKSAFDRNVYIKVKWWNTCNKNFTVTSFWNCKPNCFNLVPSCFNLHVPGPIFFSLTLICFALLSNSNVMLYRSMA